MAIDFKIENGILKYKTDFDEVHNVEAGRNSLIAGPIELSGTLNVAGNLTVTSEINIIGTVDITGAGSLTVN
jgi:hypothetical protein